MTAQRRLLTVRHSYVVALNRRLASEMGRQSGGRWEVTAAAPHFMHGDLRPIALERSPDETCRLEAFNAYLTRRVHVMFYGWRLRTLLAQNWNLVHAWEEPYILAGAQVAAWTPRHVPFVFATFQNIQKTYPPPMNLFERTCLRRCAGWIAWGETIRQTMFQRGYERRPHRIIPMGVDLECFRPAPPLERARLEWALDGPPVVGYLGRFIPEKGLRLLMRALEAVRAPWRALFVGGGALEKELRQWGEHFPGQVRIATGVPHDRVPDFLNAMDVLCAPSQTTPRWREQFGRMLIEAFACGVPVIGSDSGEIPFVVGDAGVIVAEQDIGAWTRALEELLTDAPKRRELGARGRERAAALFSWPVVARQHLDFFDALLDARKDHA